MRVRFFFVSCLATFFLPACALSLQAQALGTVRGMTDLGTEGGVALSAGRVLGNGLLMAGADANAGVFEGKFVAQGSFKIEYVRFLPRHAVSFSLHAGPRLAGEEPGGAVFLRATALEPFPRTNPHGSLGAALWGGWGWGPDAVRGGFLGVGLVWEFCDLFRWRDE